MPCSPVLTHKHWWSLSANTAHIKFAWHYLCCAAIVMTLNITLPGLPVFCFFFLFLSTNLGHGFSPHQQAGHWLGVSPLSLPQLCLWSWWRLSPVEELPTSRRDTQTMESLTLKRFTSRKSRFVILWSVFNAFFGLSEMFSVILSVCDAYFYKSKTCEWVGIPWAKNICVLNAVYLIHLL